MKFRVTLEGRFSSDGPVDKSSFLDAVGAAMSELNKLVHCDAAIDLDLSTRQITISCCVDVDDADNAVQPASDNIRLALHTGQIGTSSWPAADHPVWRVEFVNSHAELV